MMAEMKNLWRINMKPFQTGSLFLALVAACMLIMAGCMGGVGSDAVTEGISTSEALTSPNTTEEDITAATTVEDIPVADTTVGDVTETTAPGMTEPEDTVSETTVPETTVEDTTVEVTAVPETTVESTTVEVTTAPETTVESTTVEVTTVPETTVKDTTVEVTTAPETTVKDTTVEVTTVPETTEAPETACPHNYKTTITAATCTKDGKKVTVCSDCGDSTTEVIPATGHDTKTTTTEATCTKAGSKVTTCSRCDYSKTEAIKAKGHDTKTTTTAATCTADGKKVTTCSRCDYTKTETLSSLGHDYKTTTVKATCEKDGSKTTACTRCSSQSVEVIPATGHSYNAYTVKVAPTATVEGILTYTCDTCKGTYDKNIGTHSFNGSQCGNPTHISTSNNPNNYVDFDISGDTVTVQGRIVRYGLTKIWLRCGNVSTTGPNSKVIEVTSGEFFMVDLSLSEVTEKTDISIYTQVNGETSFWSYIWKEITVMPSADGFVFESSPVLLHNLEKTGQWIDPAECLSLTVPDVIRELSDEIVGDETDPYQKLYLLNKWVAENIYYDYDYLNGRTTEISLSALEVYETRRSVCDGYATLLGNLIQAQGIPCIRVSTYSTGAGSGGRFDESNYQVTEANHAHIEAYLAGENRWVTMDPTWDSGNRYENGQYITGTARSKWFDISADLMAFTHKIIERPYPFYW